MVHRNGTTRQRAQKNAKALWRIWQKIQDKPHAEDLGPAIRDLIIAQLAPWGLSPEEIKIPDHTWTQFIQRCASR